MGLPGESPTAIARVPALDGLRGIAILLVLALHFGVAAQFPQQFVAGRLIQRICYVGWSGVDLFFVLSGFLISSILLSSKSHPRYFANFYARRALRILPLYCGTLLLGLIVLPALVTLPSVFVGDGQQHAVWLWTYTTNIALAIGAVTTFGVFDIYWSLAIEEQFYLIWPLLVRVTGPRTLVAMSVIIAAGAPVLRFWWVASGHSWAGAYHFTLTRLDPLAIGALVALTVRDARARASASRVLPTVFAVAAFALVVMFVLIDPFYSSSRVILIGGQTALAVAFGCIVFFAATTGGWLATAVSAEWLRRWGKISYGAYVWHWPLRLALDLRYSRIPPATEPAYQMLRAVGFLVFGLSATYGLAWVSYYAFEQYFLRLKQRASYGATPLPAPSVGATPISS